MTKRDVRNDRIDDLLFLSGTPTHCHSSADSTSTSQLGVDARKKIDNSTIIFISCISSIVSPQRHTTSSTVDPKSIEDDIRVLISHSLPRSPQRANVITADNTPQHCIDAFKGLYHRSLVSMSAQLNATISIPLYKGKKSLCMTWLTALGDVPDGRLWLELPSGTHPPSAPQTAWETNPRGEYQFSDRGIKNT